MSRGDMIAAALGFMVLLATLLGTITLLFTDWEPKQDPKSYTVGVKP